MNAPGTGQASAGHDATATPPQPVPAPETAFFWDGLRAGQLRVQRCAACGVLRHPPGPACMACHSLEWDSIVASGRGTLLAWTVVHQPRLPGFTYPLAVGVVELEEGTRIAAPLDGMAQGPRVGMKVQALLRDCTDAIRMPVFVGDTQDEQNGETP